ncbi:MAG: MFS transporter [Candidatus Dormibacteria bacterium]
MSTVAASHNAAHDVRRTEALILAVIFLGIVLAAVDTTIVVLAIPTISHDLHSGISTVIWVIMAYILTLTVLGTQVGKIGDIFGRVHMYIAGFVIFTIGSTLCGIAPGGGFLVGFRILQGIGGALVSANSGAIIADSIPVERRGRAYGLTSVGWNVGAILGILLGGILITFVSWRFIFLINLPIGIAAIIISALVLRDRGERVHHAIDIPGMFLLAFGLTLILLAVNDVTDGNWTVLTTVKLCTGIALLIGLFIWERYAKEPVLPIALLRIRILFASIFASFFQALANFSVLFLLIMYLQAARGLTPLAASALLIPGYIVGAFTGPFGGRWSDRVGSRAPATLGLILQAVSVFCYAQLDPTSSLWLVAGISIISGIGSGLFFPANNSAVMANAPQRTYGIASGLLRTFSNMGMVGSFAVALLATSISIPKQFALAIFLGTTSTSLPRHLIKPFMDGWHTALYLATALFIIPVFLSLIRGKEQRNLQHQNHAAAK